MKTTATILCALIAVALTSSMALAQINWTEHDIDPYFNGAWGLYVIDMDGDNNLDVVGCAYDGDAVAWYENDGSQNFTKYIISSNFDNPYCVYATDVDGDNDIDVVGAAKGIYYRTGYVGLITWWENDGLQNFTEHNIAADTGANYNWAGAVDLDGDSDVDILGAATDDDRVSWWQNDGSENFMEIVIDGSFRYPYCVYTIDLDGDDDMDVLAGPAYEQLTWYENDSDENFAKHAISDRDTCIFSTSIHVADMNDDTHLDVLTNDLWEDDVLWYENDGNENFTEHTIDYNFPGCYDVCAADVDHDGDMDVVGAAWRDSAITWWENNGSLSFTRHDLTTSFTYARRAIPVDLDDDGDLDVVGSGNRIDKITWWESDLGPPGFITGIVKEQDDITPINNVEVSVYDSGDNLAGTDTTDLNGEFAFSLDPDTYYATFSKTGYNDTTLTDLVVVADETTMVNLIMYISGYAYLPGDVNMALGIWPPQCIGGDVTYLVGYFIGGGQAACMLDGFWCSADINGDCTIIGGDVTALVGYFVAGGSLVPCPDYEPLWPPLPPEAPDGWPNCDTPVINSRVIPTDPIR